MVNKTVPSFKELTILKERETNIINVYFLLSSNSSCRTMHKLVWDYIERPPKRVAVSTKAFQGVTSKLRSEK